MDINIIETAKGRVALCKSRETLIKDGQSALDFIVNIAYTHGCRNIALNKAAVSEDFFQLTTGIAGEVAQKFVNYNIRFAVIGDFTGYTSRALNDYIYECNKTGPLYFVRDETEALNKLG